MNDLLRRRRAMMKQAESGLPSAYRQVEYIEGTGTQYIDVVAESGAWDFDVTIAVSLPAVNAYNLFCGYSYWSDSAAHCIFWTSNQTDIRRKNNGQSHNAQVSTSSIAGRKCRFILNSARAAIIDAETGEILSENTDQYVRASANYIRLFRGASNSGGYERPVAAKMYEYKAYTNTGALAYDFIPCVRNADGEIGVYDLIGKQFYSNSGTGEFLIGPDVN